MMLSDAATFLLISLCIVYVRGDSVAKLPETPSQPNVVHVTSFSELIKLCEEESDTFLNLSSLTTTSAILPHAPHLSNLAPPSLTPTPSTITSTAPSQPSTHNSLVARIHRSSVRVLSEFERRALAVLSNIHHAATMSVLTGLQATYKYYTALSHHDRCPSIIDTDADDHELQMPTSTPQTSPQTHANLTNTTLTTPSTLPPLAARAALCSTYDKEFVDVLHSHYHPLRTPTPTQSSNTSVSTPNSLAHAPVPAASPISAADASPAPATAPIRGEVAEPAAGTLTLPLLARCARAAAAGTCPHVAVMYTPAANTLLSSPPALSSSSYPSASSTSAPPTSASEPASTAPTPASSTAAAPAPSSSSSSSSSQPLSACAILHGLLTTPQCWDEEQAHTDAQRITSPLPALPPAIASDPRAQRLAKVDALHALALENSALLGEIVRAVRVLTGSYSSWGVKAREKVAEKSQRPEIVKSRPWFDVEHVRDALRFKARLVDLDSLRAVLNVFLSFGVKVVQFDYDKFMDPKTFGWRPICIDLRFPNGLLVEFYAVPVDMDVKAVKHVNHELYEQWRTVDVSRLPGAPNLAPADAICVRDSASGGCLTYNQYENAAFTSALRYSNALWTWVSRQGLKSWAELERRYWRMVSEVAVCSVDCPPGTFSGDVNAGEGGTGKDGVAGVTGG